MFVNVMNSYTLDIKVKTQNKNGLSAILRMEFRSDFFSSGKYMHLHIRVHVFN